MINTNSFILLVVALLLWIQPGVSYKVTTGKTSIVEKELNFLKKGQTQPGKNMTYFYRFFIFPYNIYEYHINDTTNNTYIRSFVFLKSSFSYIQSFMNIQNSTFDLQNQIEILYERIPEIIHVVGQNNELIDIDPGDFNLECKKFIIKNSTVEKIQNGVRVYDLNFYYLQINKYLLKVINVAYYKTSDNQTASLLDDYELSIFEGAKGKTLDQLKKHKFVMQNILSNDTLWDNQDFTNYLVYRVFSRRTRQTTKWNAIYDGFTLKYFSADIYRVNLGTTNENDHIELVRIQVSEGEIKQSKVIKEPLKYLKLRQIDHFDLCRSGEKINVLFADKNLGYVIDITKEEWHLLQQIKVGTNMSELLFVFFGKDCKVYGLHQRTQQKNQTSKFSVILQYHPRRQNIKKIDMLVTHFFKSFLNLIILCDSKNNCSVFETQKFKRLNDIIFSNSSLTIYRNQSVNYRVSMMEGEVKYQLEIIDPKQKKQRWIQFTPNYTLSNSFTTVLLHPIYNSLVYRNKTKYISNEMNREVYQHIKGASFLQNAKLKQSYYQQIFSEKATGENCLAPFEFQSTIAEVKFNQTKEWSVCVWQQEINQYTQLILTFKERYMNYQLYLCASFLELYSDRMNIQCVTLLDQIGQLAQTKTMSVIQQLRSSHFYKLYIVKHNEVQQKFLPTIFVKDVERQQIEVASTIFFFIMIVLSLLLLGLVLFITLKSVVINLLIYYGFVQQRVQPTYPLAWFPLKTKLKRMQQHGVLKYIEYQPSLSDTEGNHCCFCLELIRQKTVVAQIYCGHEFHKECFKQWIKNQPNAKCPTCRRHFTRTGLIEYQHNMSSQQQLAL